jgi:hypothetical protein
MSVDVSWRTLVDGDLGEEWEPVTASALERLLDKQLAEYGATIHDQPTPDGPLRAEIIFGTRVGQERGAIYYTDKDGAWFSYNTSADDDVPEVYYSDLGFPPDSEIPLSDLRAALLEYCQTGERPTCIDWKSAD